MRLLLAAAIAALLPTACGNSCGTPERCAYPALLLTVHDAFGGDQLPDATVSQNGTPLATDFTSIYCADGSCTHAVTPPAAGPVVVSLVPYQNATVDYASRHDACGRMVRQSVDVAMSPATPNISAPTELGAGCQ